VFDILNSILDKLMKLMFHFLSTGAKTSEGIHLANWKSLAMPFRYGGWNIKHLHYFNKALNAKSLWRALLDNGLWSKIIRGKYLGGRYSSTFLDSSV